MEVVTQLLSPYTHLQGANPNSPNLQGLTPLHYAATLCRSSTDILNRLVEGGANLDILDELGRSPLVCALQALSIK